MWSFPNNLAEHYLGNRQAKEQLEEIIERQIGKYVEWSLFLQKLQIPGAWQKYQLMIY